MEIIQSFSVIVTDTAYVGGDVVLFVMLMINQIIMRNSPNKFFFELSNCVF